MEMYTQAYHAGVLLAMVHNTFPDEKTPSFVEGAVHFAALRELLGERLWQKMCARSAFRDRIKIYNLLTYQPGLPRAVIGRGEDFALGYTKVYKNSKLKILKDRERQQQLENSPVLDIFRNH